MVAAQMHHLGGIFLALAIAAGFFLAQAIFRAVLPILQKVAPRLALHHALRFSRASLPVPFGMALAGYVLGFQTAPDGSTWTSVPGVSSVNYNKKNEPLDTTSIAGGGAEAKIQGLAANSVKVSFDYNNGNAGQTNMLFNEGGRCDAKLFYSDGTSLSFIGIVESYDMDVSVNGKISSSATILQNGADTEVDSAVVTPTDTPSNATIAGYSGTVKIPGTTTAITGEATTLVSGKTYQITSASKRVLDPGVAVVVKDNGGAVADASILSIDYNFGKVTFTAAYTVLGTITIDASYLPLLSVAESTSFKLAVKNKLQEKTSFDSAGIKQWIRGVKMATINFRTLTPITSDLDSGGGTTRLSDAIKNRTPVFFECYVGVGNVFRGWFIMAADVKAAPNAPIEATVTGESTARAKSRDEVSFSWGAA